MSGTHAEQHSTKFGRPMDQIEQMLDQVTTMAAGEGLAFRFDLNRGGNSFDAHRLPPLARAPAVRVDPGSWAVESGLGRAASGRQCWGTTAATAGTRRKSSLAAASDPEAAV